jgi:O-acetyl-ADP-ribose deacetylase (regulator of RNase III)
MNVFDYQCEPQTIEASRNSLQHTIRKNLSQNVTDALVHTLIPGLRLSRPPKPFDRVDVHVYEHHTRADRIVGIITGDIVRVRGIDIWVNPENTYMEMGRLHDNSISGRIRYHGAKKEHGRVTHDTIANELSRRVGEKIPVGAGTVIPTGSGELLSHNGVKAILHVAAQHADPGGFVPVGKPEDCIVAVLEECDSLNRGSWARGRHGPLKSILFPLFGTRSQSVDPEELTYKFMSRASEHLAKDSLLDRVYFLAYTDADWHLCQSALKRLKLKKATDLGQASSPALRS